MIRWALLECFNIVYFDQDELDIGFKGLLFSGISEG